MRRPASRQAPALLNAEPGALAWHNLDMAAQSRPEVPEQWVERVDGILRAFPQCEDEPAWTGTRWRVCGATVAHIFGGHDQLYRLTFRAPPDEVLAFEAMGEPYFVVGGNSVGLLLHEATDWEEVEELLTESYLIQAPKGLAEAVQPPGVPEQAGPYPGL